MDFPDNRFLFWVLPDNMVRAALKTIYDNNVCRFAGGTMGAVNGMRPDGKVDREYIQVMICCCYYNCRIFWLSGIFSIGTKRSST